MSTRCTTHFTYADRSEAIIYRHSDGYPSGHGQTLLDFFAAVKAQTKDTRFNQPGYLAAKLVVFLAPMFSSHWDSKAKDFVPGEPLDFLSLGVTTEDPGDIEYRYMVRCDQRVGDRPRVDVQRPDGTELGEVADVLAEVPA